MSLFSLRTARTLALAVATVPAAAPPALAQTPADTTVTPPVPCRGQQVTNVVVVTRPPFHGKKGKWWSYPVRAAAALHHTTEPNVVRRFILLKAGDVCRERLRSESERVLRTQPFIAEASVKTLDDGAGGVIISVETIDEFTPILAVRNSNLDLEGARVGDGNFLGTGRRVEANWGRGDFRDAFGARITDYQFAGRPYIVDLVGERGDVGSKEILADIYHPFYIDEQRIAWRARFNDEQQLYGLFRPNLPDALFDLDRQFFDVGGVVRVGVPGRLSLFGLSFSREVDTPGLPPVIDTGVDYIGLLSKFQRRNNARVNALWGVRNIYYRKADRLDALNATQDVRYGFQLGTIFGRSINVLGTTDDDILVGSDVYLGLGRQSTFLRIQGRGEGRQNYDTDQWDGIIISGSMDLYQRVTDRHTALFSIDYGGGWRQRIPLQLTLGDPDGGVRGYRDSQDAGARRAVARLEDRWYLGGAFDQADVGLSPFVDAGYLRAGDAPYGVTTPVRIGVGIGVLAAVPRGSQRTWRVDFALAASHDPKAKWEIRLSNIDARRQGFVEPADIARSREQAVPASVFSWPY